MLKIWNKKFLTLLLSTIIIVSCSISIDNISNMSTKLNDKKSFGIKSNPLVSYDQLTYNGNWSVVGNSKQSSGVIDNKDNSITYKGNWSVVGNSKQSSGVIDNKDNSITYKGNWSSSNNSLATESNYHYTTIPVLRLNIILSL